MKYGDIILKKGYVANSMLSDWIQEAAQGEADRRTVSIVLIDTAAPDGANEIKRWNLFGCWPKQWKMVPTDGEGNDVLTEEVVIVIEWFEEA